MESSETTSAKIQKMAFLVFIANDFCWVMFGLRVQKGVEVSSLLYSNGIGGDKGRGAVGGKKCYGQDREDEGGDVCDCACF